MLVKEPTHRHSIAYSAADDTGSLRQRAASRSRNDSGQIAADRVLHVQRFTLPLGLKPWRSRSSVAATAGHHAGAQHLPPALDDMVERPQILGRPGQVQRLVQVLLEPDRSASDNAARTCSTRSDSSGPVAGSAPLTRWFLAFRPVFRSV